MTRATRPARAAAASASSGGARKTSESAAATWGSDYANGTSTIGTVGSPPPTVRLVAYWLQDTVKQSIAATASVGATAGTVTWTSRRAGPAPSVRAASSSSSTWRVKAAVRTSNAYGSTETRGASTSPAWVSASPR